MSYECDAFVEILCPDVDQKLNNIILSYFSLVDGRVNCYLSTHRYEQGMYIIAFCAKVDSYTRIKSFFKSTFPKAIYKEYGIKINCFTFLLYMHHRRYNDSGRYRYFMEHVIFTEMSDTSELFDNSFYTDAFGNYLVTARPSDAAIKLQDMNNLNKHMSMRSYAVKDYYRLKKVLAKQYSSRKRG